MVRQTVCFIFSIPRRLESDKKHFKNVEVIIVHSDSK